MIMKESSWNMCSEDVNWLKEIFTSCVWSLYNFCPNTFQLLNHTYPYSELDKLSVKYDWANGIGTQVRKDKYDKSAAVVDTRLTSMYSNYPWNYSVEGYDRFEMPHFAKQTFFSVWSCVLMKRGSPIRGDLTQYLEILHATGLSEYIITYRLPVEAKDYGNHTIIWFKFSLWYPDLQERRRSFPWLLHGNMY